MNSLEWVENNYTVVNNDVMGRVIVWGNTQGFYGIYTPIDIFISMYGKAIESALNSGEDVWQAIRDSDPNNENGFNALI